LLGLQVKIGRKDVAAEPGRCGAKVEGFDSFWAFNDGVAGGQRLGLNGVTTFVRRGLTVAANGSPLGDPALDGEGRCLLTDHGDFVVFNVYVPNAGSGARLPYKQRWLRALVTAMARERAKGKAVLLVGDLNMKHRPDADCHWEHRAVHVPSFVRAVAALQAAADSATAAALTAAVAAASAAAAEPAAETSSRSPEAAPLVAVPHDVSALAAALGELWPSIRRRLVAKEHRQLEYANARKELVPKWRASICGL